MPRYPRNYLKTNFFHVMTQGINKNYIFNNPEDINYYIKIMYELKEEQEVKILSYCIMNNHAHMLLETESTKELSKYMQRLNTKYAIYYNKKYNRIGYVFRNRYRAEGIFSEEHLYKCKQYIYNNPVKAKICKTPNEYAYSNYKEEENKFSSKKYYFIDIDEVNNKVCKEKIDEFLVKNNLKIDELKNSRIMLKELIKILKDKENI